METNRPVDDDVRTAIQQRIETFDRTYSRFRDDSIVGQISTSAGEYDFPDDVEKLVGFYRELYDATDGAVSPLVGDMLVSAGYDKNYSLRAGVIRRAPKWDEVVQWLGTHIAVREPVTLDFGAAGKGYLVDIVGEILERYGHAEYVIDASGDIRCRGIKEVIGLENPMDPSRVIGTAEIENASLCASATNRRAWGDWHHVIDPRNGQPVRDVAATWVMTPDTMVADGLATALFFVPADKLQQWDFTYVRLFADGRIEHSSDFVGQLYI